MMDGFDLDQWVANLLDRHRGIVGEYSYTLHLDDIREGEQFNVLVHICEALDAAGGVMSEQDTHRLDHVAEWSSYEPDRIILRRFVERMKSADERP